MLTDPAKPAAGRRSNNEGTYIDRGNTERKPARGERVVPLQDHAELDLVLAGGDLTRHSDGRVVGDRVLDVDHAGPLRAAAAGYRRWQLGRLQRSEDGSSLAA